MSQEELNMNQGQQEQGTDRKKPENLPVISSQRELNENLRKYYTPDRYNLLVPPAMNFSSPYHKVALVPVFCDTRVDNRGNGKDIWKPGDSEEFTFHMSFLNKLAGTANLIWTDSRSIVYEKSEEDKLPERIEHQVKWMIQKPDGSWRYGVSIGRYNYHTDKKRFKHQKQVDRRREFAETLAESNAKTRAIFEALDGIYRQYKLEDLSKPFVVPRVVEDYRDLIGDDPEAKRMYLAHIFKQSDRISGRLEEPVNQSDEQKETHQQIEQPKSDEQPQAGYDIPDANYYEDAPAEQPQAPGPETPEMKKQAFVKQWNDLGEKDRVENIVSLMKQKNYRTQSGKVPPDKESQIKLAWYLYNLPDPGAQQKEPWEDVGL